MDVHHITTQPLIGIWGTSASNVFAVGYAGTILHYNGSVWAAMTSHTDRDLVSVWGSSADNVLCCGAHGTILRYNGLTWAPMHSGTELNLEHIWGTAWDNIYTTGGYDLFHYNGSAWRKIITSADDLYGVWGSSSNDVYIAGDWGAVQHYNGIRWSQISCILTLSGNTLFDIWGSSAEDIHIVGDLGTILHYIGTPVTPVAPVVSTGAATDIITTGATLNGMLILPGSCELVNVSFQYGTVSGVYTAETPAQGMSAPGPFFAIIDTGPYDSGQTIYYRAKGVCIFGTAYGAEASFNTAQSFIGLQPQSSGGTVSPPPQTSTVSLSNIVVQSASLSEAKVAPGSPVTVTASVINRGTANGSANIRLMINGQEEISRGVTVNSGSNIPVTFTFSRSQHGSYTVYVNGVYAGSLTVEEAVEPDIILYVSVALILIALSAGSLFLLNRKRQGY